MTIQKFTIRIGDDTLEDLQRRLRATRWPAGLDSGSWEDGASLAFIRRLVDHWLSGFDWRAQEQRLNRLPHYMATLAGNKVHFVHQPGRGPEPMPLVLTHGWPGSFAEMERVLPLLSDPAAHGGDPADAFHVVVPSLPGYGFSPAPEQRGMNSKRIAGLWGELMSALGYSRFAAQGGDIGAGVSTWLARLLPERLVGVHLNYVSSSYQPPLGPALPPLSQAEQTFLDRSAAWDLEEGAYAALQATKPQTLAYALGDSPTGLAAWIAEKAWAWSDHDGDVGRAIPVDTLLTDICLYWFGNTLEASLRLYKENRLCPLVFFRQANASDRPSVSLCFRASCPCRPVAGWNASSTCGVGHRCREVAILRRWNNPSCWWTTSARSSGRCGIRRGEARAHRVKHNGGRCTVAGFGGTCHLPPALARPRDANGVRSGSWLQCHATARRFQAGYDCP